MIIFTYHLENVKILNWFCQVWFKTQLHVKIENRPSCFKMWCLETKFNFKFAATDLALKLKKNLTANTKVKF